MKGNENTCKRMILTDNFGNNETWSAVTAFNETTIANRCSFAATNKCSYSSVACFADNFAESRKNSRVNSVLVGTLSAEL